MIQTVNYITVPARAGTRRTIAKCRRARRRFVPVHDVPDPTRGIARRAKCMIMGELDLGQYCFRHTDTMLPRRHQVLMSAVLRLFGLGIIVVDVFSGDRAALAFFAPRETQDRWLPGSDYIVELAACGAEGKITCQVRSGQPVHDDLWRLGKNREHSIDAYPAKYYARVAYLAGSHTAWLWRTKVLVFIWERDAADNLAALVDHISQL